jgi:DNA-binding PadR family transcriptional regulator
MILSLLMKDERTGYKLHKLLITEFEVRKGFGTIYPRLYYLQEEKMLYSNLEGRTRSCRYGLTQKGREQVKTTVRKLRMTVDKMQALVNDLHG